MAKVNKRLTLNWFIKFFEKIPDSKWGLYSLTSYSGDKFCALGHLQRRFRYKDGYDNPVAHKLSDIVEKYNSKTDHDYAITTVNDGTTDGSRDFGQNPKERVVNFLKTIKKELE